MSFAIVRKGASKPFRNCIAWAAMDKDGIYSPGNIMTLAIYETKEHGIRDGWRAEELKEVRVSVIRKMR